MNVYQSVYSAELQPKILEERLAQLGLTFNPFQYQDSAQDPHLFEYVVGLESFANAWFPTPALIFAPAGGGKTAMRCMAARACWTTHGGAHPFPITYLPTLRQPAGAIPSLDEHQRWLGQSAAESLLIALAYRPQRFLRLTHPEQARVVAVLQQGLRRPLTHYLRVLSESSNPDVLIALLDPTYSIPKKPEAELVLELCSALSAAANHAQAKPIATPAMFDAVCEVLMDVLKFGSVFVMVDGLDGIETTQREPRVALQWLLPLLAKIDPWSRRSVFCKLFLPIELEPLLIAHEAMSANTPSLARLVWSTERIVEMLRRRIYVASDGQFDSLDAMAASELLNIERMLANSIVRPLPRHAIALAQCVLTACARRANGFRITASDVYAAQDWYRDIFLYGGYNAIQPDSIR